MARETRTTDFYRQTSKKNTASLFQGPSTPSVPQWFQHKAWRNSNLKDSALTPASQSQDVS